MIDLPDYMMPMLNRYSCWEILRTLNSFSLGVSFLGFSLICCVVFIHSLLHYMLFIKTIHCCVSCLEGGYDRIAYTRSQALGGTYHGYDYLLTKKTRNRGIWLEIFCDYQPSNHDMSAF